jgi:hypothetical protein
MFNSGYIKIHRKITEWGWYKDQNTKDLFFHLLLKANYKNSEFMGHQIKRGELIFGRKIAAEETGISEQSIRTSLYRLKSTGEITIKSTNKFSIITICNYEFYQNKEDEIDQQINQVINQQLTSNQPATNQQLTTSEEYKEKKNDKKDKNKHIIPLWKEKCSTFEKYQEWELEEYEKIRHDQEWITQQQELNPRIDILMTLKKAHINYWSQQGGYKNIKARRGDTVDWRSTWTNALTVRMNQVWQDRNGQNQSDDSTSIYSKL